MTFHDIADLSLDELDRDGAIQDALDRRAPAC
jgi:hypothetical protein